MSDYDIMLKNAEDSFKTTVRNIKTLKENAMFLDKHCVYIFGNNCFDSLEILKEAIKYEEIGAEFKKNLFYYRSCLNHNFNVKKYFVEQL